MFEKRAANWTRPNTDWAQIFSLNGLKLKGARVQSKCKDCTKLGSNIHPDKLLMSLHCSFDQQLLLSFPSYTLYLIENPLAS